MTTGSRTLPPRHAQQGSEEQISIRPACPICGTASPLLHEVSAHDYYACPGCAHQFLDLEPADSHTSDQFGDGYFSGEGDGYPDYLGNRDLLIARGKHYAKLIARHTGKSSGELLDIGSAAGFLAKGFQSSGWSAQGLEPNQSMAAHASNHEDIPTSSEAIESFRPDQRFDLVLMIQVIGHLEDPAATLRAVRQLLKPGGYLLIETWNCRSITARVLGSRWHEYNPPSVLHAFSRQSLTALAEGQGFRPVASKLTAKKIKATHAKALIEHKYQGGRLHKYLLRPVLTLLPDRVSIPYPADDLFWTCLTPG